MNVKFLTLLVHKLESLTEKDPFDMKNWSESATTRAIHRCGTHGCAAGYATQIPEIRKAGLRLKVEYGDLIYPVYKGFEEKESIMECFELTENEVDSIFYRQGYYNENYNSENSITPKDVATKIRNLLKEAGHDIDIPT